MFCLSRSNKNIISVKIFHFSVRFPFAFLWSPSLRPSQAKEVKWKKEGKKERQVEKDDGPSLRRRQQQSKRCALSLSSESRQSEGFCATNAVECSKQITYIESSKWVGSLSGGAERKCIDLTKKRVNTLALPMVVAGKREEKWSESKWLK